MLQNSLRYNSVCASQRFSFLGSPSNGPLSFFILTFVAISLPLGLFFLSFYMFDFVLQSPDIFEKAADYCFHSNRI